MKRADEIRLALSPHTLARLLAEKRVSAEEFRCLDNCARSQVKSMFLNNLRTTMTGIPVPRDRES